MCCSFNWEKRGKHALFKRMLIAFDCSIFTGALVSKWHYFTTTEWVLKVGCVKPVNVLRYSDAVVLISQLSKSCSCGIKTNTVPVSDLGGGWGGGGDDEENNHSHQGLYWFHLPQPRSGWRVASGGEMVSGDIISLLFTQGGRELEDGWVSQATFFFTSFSWSEDHGIKEGLVATWDLCDWLIYCGDGRSFIYGNI